VGDTHVVDVHLSNLRRKLQQHAPELRFIHTVRGIGFRLSNDLLRTMDADDGQVDSGDDRELISA
jgi:two-component system OmpR family response regulator